MNEYITIIITLETDSGSGGLSPGAIAGIVIGSLIGVGILAGIIIHLDKQKKAKGKQIFIMILLSL